MTTKIRPIQRSLLIASSLFVVVLCIALAVQAYIQYTASLYSDRNSRLESAITYVEHNIDADDLLACVDSGIPSEKHQKLQQLLNILVDDLSLDYLYLTIPVDDEVGTMINVVSATSQEERDAGEVDLPLLYTDPMYYYYDDIKPYVAALDNPGISFFEEVSESGACYTACKPVTTSDGEFVCLICADLYTDDLHAARNNYVLTNIALTIVIGLVFVLGLIWWLRRFVTSPLETLEQRARVIADTPRQEKSLESLHFDVSDIHTGNEVESLASAISTMVDDMRHFMQDNLEAKQRAADAEHEIADMTRIVNQDALTKVKSKAAYDQHAERLAWVIREGSAEFAIVMADLNNLKVINDTYGHERGDDYIIGACNIICSVFAHSPVFRVGGDEFVVLSEGADYWDRDRLVKELEEKFASASRDTERNPWDRSSAAVGMAVFDASTDKSVEDVFNRADKLMYQNKKEMKEGSSE